MTTQFTQGNPLHVHVENARSLMPVFQVRRDQYDDALRRHPDVAQRIRTTWGWDQENWKPNAKTADAMITYRFPKESLAADAPNLKLLQILGAGVDYLLPLDWVPRGVKLLSNSGAHVPKAAQSGLMTLLMLNARMPELIASHRARKWNRVFTDTLAGKTLLIIGVGAIGTGIAEHAKHFGMRVIGIRRSGAAQPHVDEMHKPDALHTLLPRADFVLLNTALTPETRFIIGKRELALVKKGAALVNMSRGGLVDPAALDEALRSGQSERGGDRRDLSRTAAGGLAVLGHAQSHHHAARALRRHRRLRAAHARPVLRQSPALLRGRAADQPRRSRTSVLG